MNYQQEINRTDPDFVVYKPSENKGNDSENQHFLVIPDNQGSFLAFWTAATREASKDQRVVFSKSTDLGRTWSAPKTIDGQQNGDGKMASWGFPIYVSHSNRIYFFYNKHVGISDVRDADTGQMWFKYSDDNGETWSQPYTKQIRRSAISHPDPSVPNTWIVWQVPLRAADGIPIAGFTRWTTKALDDNKTVLTSGSESWFLRFENIMYEDNPEKIEVNTLPESDFGVRVPKPDNPKVSIAQEPSIVLLPDNRLFCVMRTFTGYIWYTISTDHGRNWSSPKPLRYCDNGPKIPQPLSSSPIYPLADGRYLLFFNNNTGDFAGGTNPANWEKNRRPLFISTARFHPAAEQPLWFNAPKQIMDTDGVALGPCERTEIATYPSFFEFRKKRYFWYPDRKHFLLGKLITDEMID